MTNAVIPPPVDLSQSVVVSYADEQVRLLEQKKAQRSVEALRMYEPMPQQAEFHACMAREVVARGSNRSGKTTVVACEIARAATGQDPYCKYPLTGGKILVVGKDQKHIAGVFYKKLFRNDAFRIIKDLTTKKWRVFREWDEADKARKAESKMSPPLIPARFIKEIAWANKKAGVPEVVTLKTGWEIWFFTGEGDPPQGITAEIAWFDEEIPNGRWYEEIAARLGDKNGRFYWSATPQNSTLELYTLSKRAFDERFDANPSVVEFYMTMANNKFYPQEERIALEKKYANNPEAYKIRILGEFNVASYLVYPTFARALHGIKPYNPDTPLAGGVEIGNDWNRYIVVDPGRVVCAVGFFAVPPPLSDYRDQRFLYDELYIRNCNAEIFGDRVYSKASGLRFQAFLIDPSSARQDTIGGGPSVFAQYAEALRKRRVECVNSGSNFTFACNDQRAGLMKFESWLHVSAEFNRPKFQYFEDRCPNFTWEIEQYRRKKDGDVITDKPIDRDDHLCLVAGTQIICRRGSVAIEDVTASDEVWTRNGWRSVTWAGPTKISKTTKVTLSNCGTLEGTADHRVWVQGSGWVQLSDLQPGDLLESPSCHAKTCFQRPFELCSGESRIGGIRTPSDENCRCTSLQPVDADCIEQFGSITEGQFQKATAYITETEIRSTTALEILNANRTHCTHLTTLSTDGLRLESKRHLNCSRKPTLPGKCTLGAKPSLVKSELVSPPKQHGKPSLLSPLCASNAADRTKANHHPRSCGFAPTTAALPLVEKAESMIFKSHARCVDQSSRPTVTPATNTVVRVVGVQRGSQEKQTYDLTVDGEHEFYANGVLTHNCDVVRYFAMHDPQWVPQPKFAGRQSPALKMFLALAEQRDAEKEGAGSSVNLGPGPSRN